MTYLLGWGVRDDNFQLRFFAIIFMGLMALGSVVYWRSQLILSSEYVDIPMAKHLSKHQIDLELEQ